MNREDFLMLNNDIIYFDNSATTFKPKQVLDKMIDYFKDDLNKHKLLCYRYESRRRI